MADIFTDSEIHELLLPYAIQVAEDFDRQSSNAINAFYGDYEPMIYDRTFGMQNMWKTEIEPIENGYTVRITYSPEFFGKSHRSDDAVFAGSFGVGYHGGPLAWGRPKKHIPQMQPSPWELIEEFFLAYDF